MYYYITFTTICMYDNNHTEQLQVKSVVTHLYIYETIETRHYYNIVMEH